MRLHILSHRHCCLRFRVLVTGRITIRRFRVQISFPRCDEAKGGEQSVFDHPVPQVSGHAHVVKPSEVSFQPPFGSLPVIVTSAAVIEEPQPCVNSPDGSTQESQGARGSSRCYTFRSMRQKLGSYRGRAQSLQSLGSGSDSGAIRLGKGSLDLLVPFRLRGA